MVSKRNVPRGWASSRFVGRHRGGVAAATLALVAVLAGLVGTITQARRAEGESERQAGSRDLARPSATARSKRSATSAAPTSSCKLVMRDAATGDAGALRRRLDRKSVLLDKTEFETPVVKVGLLRLLVLRARIHAALGQTEKSAADRRKASAHGETTHDLR